MSYADSSRARSDAYGSTVERGVEWPAFEAGRMAAEMLIDKLAGREAAPRQQLFPPELVVRESTGPGPRSRRATRPGGSQRGRTAG